MPAFALPLLAFAQKHVQLVATLGGFALLGILLLIARADASHWKKQDVADVAALMVEQAKHAVTRASLDTCMGSVDAQNKAIDKLKADGDALTASTGKAIADARAASQSAEGTARALEASAAGTKPGGACRGSAAYLAAKAGL